MPTRRTGFESSDRPCPQCPWRLANQGRRHPGGWYTRTNLRRLWAGLRRGERMTCHPTDPDNAIECECHAPPPPGTPTRECAGALILMQREAQRYADLAEEHGAGAYPVYRRAHPKGLTRDGLAVVLMAVTTGSNPFTGHAMKRPDLNDDRIGYAELVPWEQRHAQA